MQLQCRTGNAWDTTQHTHTHSHAAGATLWIVDDDDEDDDDDDDDVGDENNCTAPANRRKLGVLGWVRGWGRKEKGGGWTDSACVCLLLTTGWLENA